MKIALQSRRVLLPAGFQPAVLHLDGDRIVHITPTPLPGFELRDVGESCILPALTDSHVHINEPGRSDWEGFWTATRAAAAGGVTLLVDMPLNSDPVTTSLEALEKKKGSAAGKLHVDVGFWGGVVPGNVAELAPMVRAGALGFKCFTCFSGIDDFPASTRADLLEAMPVLRELGVPLLVHAELESELKDANIDASSRLYKNYLHSRPSAWEDAAVAMVVELVALTGCRAHIVHLSSADALDLVRRAKMQGLPITAETCPHYLGLAAEEVPDGATQFKCAPPIRERENQERLWAGLLDGTLDFVVTDHSPCIPALKKMEEGTFMDAWGGIASLQLGLRSVWTEAQRRGIALERLIGWMSAATAAFVGRPERGILREGGPADFLLFQPEHEERLEARTLLHRHPQSPWVGRRLAGAVEQTWMRGQPIWSDGKICGEAAGKIYLGGRNHV